jgi:hypothetical protein
MPWAGVVLSWVAHQVPRLLGLVFARHLPHFRLHGRLRLVIPS